MEDKKEIIGYKCFDENLQAFNGFQYEIGKTYEMEEEPEVGRIGFHFLNDLEDVFRHLVCSGNKRICKVKILGDVDSRNRLNCTNKIEIVEELVIDEKVKESLLNKLVNDESCYVRAAVAREGYMLDKLINDEDWFVRAEVARQGYKLDKLIDDKHHYVRQTVAEQGYGLDKLINDENAYVREAVARQGYGLNKLINDEDSGVKECVVDYVLKNYPDLAQDIQQLIINYLNKAED